MPCQGSYGPFGVCSAACGTGVQTSPFAITAPSKYGGTCPQATTPLTSPCYLQPCRTSVACVGRVGLCVREQWVGIRVWGSK